MPEMAESDGTSGLDPRARLLLTLGFIVVVTALPDGAWVEMALLASSLLVVAVITRTDWASLLRRVVLLLPFAALAALSLPFTTAGETLLRVGPLRLTDRGMLRFAALIGRTLLSITAASLLVRQTPMPQLFQALQSLGVPRLLVAIAASAYRYSFILAEEAARMDRARRSRSADLPCGRGRGLRWLWWRAWGLGGMIGMLFLRSYERSERIYLAMVARGYAGTLYALEPPAWQRRDLYALVGGMAGLLLCLLMGVR